MTSSAEILLTRHAETRSQQRGIRTEVMDALMTHGASHISHGCEVVFMDRPARRRVREAIGRAAYAKLERALDTYLVVGRNGAIVTCAHRTRRRLRAA